MTTPAKNEREVRTICAELRAMPAADGKPAKICGHAANFNSMSQDLADSLSASRLAHSQRPC